MKRRGFTIVELLLVVAIIGVLAGIITTAVSSSMKGTRRRKADALCNLVQAALATYHAQKGEWPVASLSSKDASDGNDNGNYELQAGEVQTCMKALIDEAKAGNPLMDISGLFVSRDAREPLKETCRCGKPDCDKYQYRAQAGATGLDFWSAIHGTKQSKTKMSTGEMHFGYPHPEDGRFMRFRMSYNIPSDALTVWQWHWPDEDDDND